MIVAPRQPPGDVHRTAVTVVVPVRDEARSVTPLVESLCRQSLPPDGVIMVDGGSSDDTVEVLARLLQGRQGMRVIEAGDATPGRGRNVGIELVSTPWVALTDAGIELDRRWLERLMRPVQVDPTVDVVFGSYGPSRRSRFERWADVAYVSPLTPSRVGPVRSHFVASLLMRKTVWREIGGFPNLRSAEDLIFLDEIQRRGFNSVVSPEARVTWEIRPNLQDTYRRFRLYSKHNVLAGQEGRWHHAVARQYVAVAVGMLLAKRRSGYLAAGLFGAAQLAKAARSAYRRREGRGPGWVLDPVQLVAVAGIRTVIDLAMFVGWFDACRERQSRRSPS